MKKMIFATTIIAALFTAPLVNAQDNVKASPKIMKAKKERRPIDVKARKVEKKLTPVANKTETKGKQETK